MKRPVGRWVATAALAVGVPICAAAADATGTAQAPPPAADAHAAFAAGNTAYAAGQYDEAARLFRAAAEARPAADAYFNLGTAEAQAGHLGPAIWAFEQALVLTPEDEDARFNLDAVRQTALRRGLAMGGDTRLILPGDDDVGTGLLTALTPNTVTIGFAGFWIGMFGLLTAGRLGRRRGMADGGETRQTVLTLGAVTAALGALAFGGLLAGRVLVLREASYGVVVAEKGVVQAGPGAQYRPVARVLGGVKLRLRGADGEWMNVVLPDGATGWVRADEIAPLRNG